MPRFNSAPSGGTATIERPIGVPKKVVEVIAPVKKPKAIEVVDALAGAAGVEEVVDVPELTISQRSEQLLTGTGLEVAEGMNLKISHENQAGDAKAYVEPLIDSREMARAAVELERYERGEIDAEKLGDIATGALVEGKTAAEVMEIAEVRSAEALAKKAAQKEALEFDKRLDGARTAYIEALTSSKGLLPAERERRRVELEELEQAYNKAFVDRISQFMDLDPNHRKAPYVVDVMQNVQDPEVTFESLSGNQLHILADQIARETLIKEAEIEERSSVGVKRVVKAFKNNRALRVIVGGAIWGVSVAASTKGMLPGGLEAAGSVFEKILPLVAGYVTSREVFSGIDEGVGNFQRNRKNKKDLEALTESTFLSDAALRSVYSGIEYDGIVEREAKNTQEENQKVFSAIDKEFAGLERSGSRGGKPYKAEDIIPIVSDLYLRRGDEIRDIVEADDPKEAFLGLCMEVIKDDSDKLTSEVHTNRAKNTAFRALSVVSSVLVGHIVGAAADLQTASVKPIKWAEQA